MWTPHFNLSQAFCSPSATRWLGCDAFGVSLGELLFHSAAYSLQVAVLACALAVSVGIFFGTICALQIPVISFFSKRLVDAFLSIPGVLISIYAASVMPRNTSALVFALAITGWATTARLTEQLSKKEFSEPYVEAAIAAGGSRLHVLLKHIFPALYSQWVLQCIFTFTYMIFAEAALSYFGIQSQSQGISLGSLIAEGRHYLIEAPRLSLIPGGFLFLIQLFLHAFADRMRVKLDPFAKAEVY